MPACRALRRFVLKLEQLVPPRPAASSQATNTDDAGADAPPTEPSPQSVAAPPPDDSTEGVEVAAASEEAITAAAPGDEGASDSKADPSGEQDAKMDDAAGDDAPAGASDSKEETAAAAQDNEQSSGEDKPSGTEETTPSPAADDTSATTTKTAEERWLGDLKERLQALCSQADAALHCNPAIVAARQYVEAQAPLPSGLPSPKKGTFLDGHELNTLLLLLSLFSEAHTCHCCSTVVDTLGLDGARDGENPKRETIKRRAQGE